MHFDAAILDLHGTVYLGDRLLPGAKRGLAALESAGVDRLFFSNNPTRTPAQFAVEMGDLGLPVDPEEVLTAGVVTVEYLHDHHAADPIFVVGEPGLIDQFDGLTLTENPREAGVLLASIDRSFRYDDLTAALRAVEGGAAFLGTDPDRTIPTSPEPTPGSGAIIGAVAATVGRDPDAVLGKPSEQAAHAALEHLGHPERVLVVGDRLDTDVALGERIGATTVLVESGIHDRTAIDGHEFEPDHVIDSLTGVVDLLSIP